MLIAYADCMLIVVVVFFYTEGFTEKREIHEETEK